MVWKKYLAVLLMFALLTQQCPADLESCLTAAAVAYAWDQGQTNLGYSGDVYGADADRDYAADAAVRMAMQALAVAEAIAVVQAAACYVIYAEMGGGAIAYCTWQVAQYLILEAQAIAAALAVAMAIIEAIHVAQLIIAWQQFQSSQTADAAADTTRRNFCQQLFG